MITSLLLFVHATMSMNVVTEEAAPRRKREPPAAVRSSTKPGELGFGLGSKSFVFARYRYLGADCDLYGVCTYARYGRRYYGGYGTLPIHYLYHPDGEGSGFAIGANLNLLFNARAVGLELGPVVRWDFQPIRDVGFYVGPQIGAGYTLVRAGGITDHGGYVQPAVVARLVLGDVGHVFIRPAQFTFAFGREWFDVTYDFIIGGGLTF